MRIDMPPRKPRGESIIPMINVVFLLLIFFLLTAQISQPTPFPLTPPESTSEVRAEDRDVLFISAEGELAWNEAAGEAVWDAIAAQESDAPVEVRADAATPAVTLAEHLARLRAIRTTGASLVVSKG
ncbi:ExbD/TolR family protein [Paracoccus beibuensis]|uniref:ExbD/TolR family protein n=1 Tax=Paracoccus beibuensis TaxID=547602 RepID=UPI00223F2AF5|nr:biopolymer transporter ExbD [Paracoccus beibuensis]